MLYFDAFTHFGPFPGAHGSMPWTFEHLLEELHQSSISGALVSSALQTNYDAMHENLRLSERLADHDNLFPIWNVHPHWTGDFPEPPELGKQLASHDVRAVTIFPKTNRWQVQSQTSRPLFEELQRLNRLVIIRTAAEIEPDEVEYLAGAYPNLPLLLTCVTWGQSRQYLPLVMNYPNVHLAFDSCQLNNGIEYLVGKGFEDQLIFASNAPRMSAGAHRAYIDWADITEAQKQKVAGGNLSRLLGGLTPPREVVNENEDELATAARAGKPLPCLTLDMHAHILGEGMHGAGGSYMMRDGGPGGVKKLADRMGVDGIGFMSWIGPVAVEAKRGNADVTATLDALGDFAWGLATFDVIHDSPQTMRAEMEAVYKDKRFLGIKPYPKYGIRYDDPRYDVWWEFANERGLYVGVHPVAWYQRGEFESICSRFPNLTVVGYHVGGSYEIADVAISLAKEFANFMCEPTLTPVCGRIIEYLVEGCGEDRVMYGSDLPMRDPRQQLGWIVHSRLPLAIKRKVLGENASKLLAKVRQAASEAI